MMKLTLLFLVTLSFSFLSCSTATYQTRESAPEVEAGQMAEGSSAIPDTSIYHWKADTSWVNTTMRSLSLRDKVAQMIVAYTWTHYMSDDNRSYDQLVHLVQDVKIGGLVVSLGDIYEQAMILNRLQKVAEIPLLVSSDYEYGLGMRLQDAIGFPSNMGLGATRDSTLVYKIGRVVGEEARAVGVLQNYAPVSDVNDNPDNPIINVRSFGENPQLVGRLASAFVKGTQDAGVVATAKHFPGHGDTNIDSHMALPVIDFGYGRLDTMELVPFRDDVASGIKSVMVAHIAFPKIVGNSNVPGTLSPEITTGLLQDSVGFHGLIVTDALTMRGVTNEFSAAEAAVMAVKAGADILLMPPDEETAINAITHAVQRGEISEARIDNAVRKILTIKSELGLNRDRYINVRNIAKIVGIQSHRLLAEKAARRSITIVKNDGNILPLQYHQSPKILCLTVTDNMNAATGMDFRRELSSRYRNVMYEEVGPWSNQIDFDNVYQLAKSADMILLPTYVSWSAGQGTVDFSKPIQGFLDTLLADGKPSVMVSFGNPYLLRSVPNVSAYVCAYSGTRYVVQAAVEALFGETNVTGKLPVTIPDVAQYGDGIDLPKTSLRYADPVEAGFSATRLARLDSIMNFWIADSAFPGAELLVAKDGKIVFDKPFGTYDYSPYSRRITLRTMYDLASLTKVTATTFAAMKLYDEGKLDLYAPVARYIPQFAQNGKENVTIMNLMVHDSGLPPDPPRHLWNTDAIPQDTLMVLLKHPRLFLTDSVALAAHKAMYDSLYATPLVYKTGTKMVYSDINFLVLAKVIQKITGEPINEYVENTFYKPLGMTETMFTPPLALKDICAPTEFNVDAGHLLQGIVHDENARSLGGVAGHAGLFSTSHDLAIYLQMMLNGGVYDGHRYLHDSTIALFTKRHSSLSTRALGWDTKAPEHSSAGRYFSPTSWGHLGFTGTSVWVDPVRKLFVILLTNRVCPTRVNYKIARVRPAVANAVIEALKDFKMPQKP